MIDAMRDKMYEMFERWNDPHDPFGGLDSLPSHDKAFYDGWQAALEHAGWGDRLKELAYLVEGWFEEESNRNYGDADIWLNKIRNMASEGVYPTSLDQPPAPAVPEGWKMVPVEPTHIMQMEGAKGYRESNGGFYVRIEDAYRAMLNATPEPPERCPYPDCGCPIDKTTVCAKGLPDR